MNLFYELRTYVSVTLCRELVLNITFGYEFMSNLDLSLLHAIKL